MLHIDKLVKIINLTDIDPVETVIPWCMRCSNYLGRYKYTDITRKYFYCCYRCLMSGETHPSIVRNIHPKVLLIL